MFGATSELREVQTGGAKRRMAESGGGRARTDMAAAFGKAPATIGEGDYQQPIVGAMLQGMTYLAEDVKELRGINIQSYEGPASWNYAVRAKQAQVLYGEHCRKAKGSGVVVGDVENYAFVGLMDVMVGDARVSDEVKKVIKEHIAQKVMVNGEPSMEKSKEVAEYVGACKATVTKSKSFIDVNLRGQAGLTILAELDRILRLDGKRQWDPTPSKPVFKGLKSAMQEMRRG